MSMNLVTVLYLIASICFIQALKGLSHPTTSRRGNLFGMLGMGALRSFDKYQGTGAVQVGGTSPSVKLGKSLEGAR